MQELALERKELRLTRREAKRQADALNKRLELETALAGPAFFFSRVIGKGGITGGGTRFESTIENRGGRVNNVELGSEFVSAKPSRLKTWPTGHEAKLVLWTKSDETPNSDLYLEIRSVLVTGKEIVERYRVNLEDSAIYA